MTNFCNPLEPRLLFAAGAPDPSFGTNGIASSGVNGSVTNFAYTGVATPDGGHVAVGVEYPEFAVDINLVKTTPSGTLDATFDGDGRARIDLGGLEVALGAAVTADGKIIVTGYIQNYADQTGANWDVFVVRINGNGSLDTTFGNNGSLIINLGSSDSPGFPLIQPDGKILIPASTGASGRTIVLLRLMPNGQFDSTFGSNGRANIDIPGYSNEGLSSLALDAQGRIVGAGEARNSFAGDGLIARFTASGALDTTFGANQTGYVVVPIRQSADWLRSVAISAIGQIVVAGMSSSFVSQLGDPTGDDVAILRLTAAGVLDASFSLDGIATFDFGSTGNKRHDYAYDIELLADGSVIVAGSTSAVSTFGTADDPTTLLFRVTSNGVRDTSYNGGLGRAANGSGEYYALHRNPANGNLVSFGGVEETGGNVNVLIARNLSGGAFDPAFGGGGRVTVDAIGPVEDLSDAQALQPDGKLIQGGYADLYNAQGWNFSLSRVLPNGALDPTFGNGGRVLTDFGGNDEKVHALAVQPDGKIIAAGYTREQIDFTYGFALVRYNTDGSLDTSFGTGGRVSISGFVAPGTGIVLPGAEATDVFALDDGRIMVVGRATGYVSCLAMARLTATGQLDPTFGIAGRKTIRPGNVDYFYRDALQMPDGTFIAAGDDNDTGFVLTRVNASGDLDASFNPSATPGFRVFNSAISGDFHSLAKGADGKFTATINPDSNDALVRRFNADGTDDLSFSGDGNVAIDLGTSATNALGVTTDSVGRTYIAVFYNRSTGVTRLLDDGSLDETFGTAGVTLLPPRSVPEGAPLASHVIRALDLRPDGKVIGTGYSIGGRPNIIDFHAFQLLGDPLAAPTVSANGPYTVAEGSSVNISGTATAAAGASVASIEWDLNYDGLTFSADATGATPSFSAVGLDGPLSRTIALRATDNFGSVSTIATATVNVTNVAPTATLGNSGPVNPNANATLQFSGIVDPSPGDVAALRFNFDFNNDGVWDVIDSTASSAAVPAIYLSTAGSRTMRAMVRDDDGGSNSYTTTLIVNTPAGALISGALFADFDRDGVRDAGEYGIAGRTIYNDANNNLVFDTGERTTITDFQGNYAMYALPAAAYKIRQIRPADWFQTTPTNNFGHTITLAANQQITGRNFGTYETIAPILTASAFQFETSPHLSFTFDDNVSASLGVSDLTLQNLTTATTVSSTQIALEWQAASLRANFTFPGFAGGALPDGNYRATLNALGIADEFGNVLAANGVVDFFVFAGDANRDRSVNIGDFSILASRFNLPGTFSQGDFNYDGITNISDFAILASKFNTSLPVLSAVEGPAPSALPRAFANSRIGASSHAYSTMREEIELVAQPS